MDREGIQQVKEWSYAPPGTPEHDRFAIVQEWNLSPHADFAAFMPEVVAWVEKTIRFIPNTFVASLPSMKIAV